MNLKKNEKAKYRNWVRVRPGYWRNTYTGDLLVFGDYYGTRSWMIQSGTIVLDGGSFRDLADKYNSVNSNSISGFFNRVFS